MKYAYVYGMESEEGIFKFGLSGDPDKRAKDVEKECASKIIDVRYGKPYERHLAQVYEWCTQGVLIPFNIESEWFRPGDQVIEMFYAMEDNSFMGIVKQEMEHQLNNPTFSFDEMDAWGRHWRNVRRNCFANIYEGMLDWKNPQHSYLNPGN